MTGGPLTRAEAERVLACPDLVERGCARRSSRARSSTATASPLGGSCVLEPGQVTTQLGRGRRASHRGNAGILAETLATASALPSPLAARGAADRVFRSPILLDLAGGDHLALADLATALKRDGLESLAEVELDWLGDTENAVEVVRAVRHSGLAAWRATVSRASIAERLDLIERAAAVQRETGAFNAFAPLPRVDVPDEPSTGYDDVRTIAIARLICAGIPSIQVDWPLYGPKLAQVAIAYGADDIDGVAAVDTLNLGPRRAPREDIERQIRAAFADPIERDGRYETRP